MDSQPVLRLYNTSARAEEVFVPLDASRVRMYVCGPTVYDRAHIGNARPIIVFDVLFRLLRKFYGEAQVTYVRNITDVDDKINARAAERGISIRELTEETTKVFHADVAALGCLPPSHEPRATDHIGDMIRLIERLIARGHAYAAEGHVLFQVASMPRYGQLARRSLDEMEAGARVEVAPYKRDPMDFVLWKPSPEDLPGWDSPWGRGRPGWHIECSAMSMARLLEPFGGGLSCDDPLKNAFDIHGGGIDLVFPHHENEVAQSCCALDVPRMANVWMHNGFLQVEGQKMSKSLGNFRTIGEVLAEWPGDVARLAMLMTNYRQPIDWTQSKLSEARAKLGRWRQAVAGVQDGAEAAGVFAALAQDLNTWGAVAEMDRLAKVALAGGVDASGAAAELLGALNFFGFDQAEAKTQAEKAAAAGVDAAEIEALIAARLAARAAKNWAESDRIRDELKGRGIVLKDNKDGTTAWELEL